jgi:hypothetical protein
VAVVSGNGGSKAEYVIHEHSGTGQVSERVIHHQDNDFWVI